MTNACDTNVLLYLVLPQNPKSLISRGVVDAGGIISVQVLNEFVAVARRKLKMNLDDALDALAPIKQSFEIVPVTEGTHKLAMSIAAATNFSIYDCNIIAAAELAGCDTLYSEDMSHGHRVGRVTILNPFMAA